MLDDLYYLNRAKRKALEDGVECGAVMIGANGKYVEYSNARSEYSYIECLNDPIVFNNGATLYLTHGVNPRNAMKIVEAGIKRVVFIKEFGIGVGTALLRSQGVEVVQCEAL